MSELAAVTGRAQPDVSHHLACLRESGVVTSRQEGRFVYYALADPRVEDVLRDAEGILADVAARVYACTRYQD